MEIFLPSSSISEDILFISPDILADVSEQLSGKIVQYLVIDARHSGPLSFDEITKTERIPCQKRVFISNLEVSKNPDFLRKILRCVDKKWLGLLRDKIDIPLMVSLMEKFTQRLLKKDYPSEVPFRNDKLYSKGFEGWEGNPGENTADILSQESDWKIRLKDKFFAESPLKSDCGTPDLIFSEEEIIKTSSKIIDPQPESQDSDDLIIPASPIESQPLFRRRPLRKRILSTQTSLESRESQEQPPEPKKPSGKVTPNLFESSDEEEAVKEDSKEKNALNTSTPLSNGSQKEFLISQSPIQPPNRISRPEAPDSTHDGTEVFEITTNPTFSHQIRVSSKREVSPLSPTPRTPELAKDIPSTSGKWKKSSTKREPDKTETPRSSKKSSGWLCKVSPKRSQHQRLTPRNLSITFEVRKKEEQELIAAFERPILTQEDEEGFPRKRRRLRELLPSSSEEDL